MVDSPGTGNGERGTAEVENSSPNKPRVTVRGVALVLSVLALVALNWAALDDITTGSEPGYFWEWAVVFLTLGGVVVGVLVGLRKK